MDFVIIDKKEHNKKQIVFTGCGGMLPYYFGIAQYLQENYNLDNIIFGGVSGGAIITLFFLLKKNMESIFKTALNDICNNIKKKDTGALFNMLDILKDYLIKYFDENCSNNEYISFNNNSFISVSSIYPHQKTIISNWESNNDFIDCVIASCSLPLLGNNFFCYYRDSYCLDGCFYNNRPILYQELPILFITPYKWRIIPPSWFVIGTDSEWYNKLFNLGYKDAVDNKLELDEFLC